jgi:hypothetical protein
MRLSIVFLFAFLLVTVLGAPHIRRAHPGESEYNRRKDANKVKKKLVEYWSRPDVLENLPPAMKPKVETYIKKFPQYQWKGESESSGTGSGSGSRKSNPCNTQ